jgi:outer membrane protein assembly factor BamD (BamD/ComL family)
MRRLIAVLGCASLALGLSAGASAQRGTVAKGPDPSVVSNLDEEKNSKHNLEVARHYFKLKKAYLAAYDRSEEIIAGHPTFSRLDEVLYIAAMSGIYLSEGKGKQKAPTSPPERAAEYAPEALRANARAYLTRLVTEFPDSDFRKEAEAALRQLGGPQPAAATPERAVTKN